MGNSSALAITSLVLGIVSIFFGYFPIAGQLLSIGAIIFGIIGLHNIKKDPALTGKGMAIAGIILGAIALLISILILVGMMALFNVIRSSNITQNITP